MALARKEPDRVPIDLGSTHVSTIHVDAHTNLLKHLGLKPGAIQWKDFVQQVVDVDERILEKFEIDTRGLRANPGSSWRLEVARTAERESFTDEWGVTWQKPVDGGFYFDIAKFPLENAKIEDFDNFPWPNADDSARTAGLAEKAKKMYEETDYAIVADVVSGSVLELIWFQIGLVRYLSDLLLDPAFIKSAIEKSLVIQKKMMKNFLQSVGDFVQVVAIDGDLAGQESPLISPSLYQEVLKPYEKGIFQFVRGLTRANLFRHTCGSILGLIPDLIDVGIETLNPIQVNAKGMDTAVLKRDFGSRMNFWGAVDNRVLSGGSVHDVKNEVKKRIRDLAPGGGYVLGAVHNIQRDVTPANICAMIDAAREYGEYPIRI